MDFAGRHLRNRSLPGGLNRYVDDSRQVQMAWYNPDRNRIPHSPLLPDDHALR